MHAYNVSGGICMKKIILGIVIGVIIASVLPVSATIEEFLCYKADYRVMIDGKEYNDPDRPILNYKGSTYAPLRSMLEFAGMNVAWNAELGMAEITKAVIEKGEENTVETSVIEKTDNKITTTYDGTLLDPRDCWTTVMYEGKEYGKNHGLAYSTKGALNFNSVSKEMFCQNPKTKKVLNNIPYITVDGEYYIEMGYYYSVIIPFLNETGEE
jgi:hypothetical protein